METGNSDPPLVVYVFTKDMKLRDLFVQHTQSGSMCINDTMMQYVGKILKDTTTTTTNFNLKCEKLARNSKPQSIDQKRNLGTMN